MTPATLHWIAAQHGLAVRNLLGHGWVCHILGSRGVMTLGHDLDRAGRKLLLIALELGRGGVA